jgi:hypothetical protein
VIRQLEHSLTRLVWLIDKLVAVCLDIDPALLEALPRVQQNHGPSISQLKAMDRQQVLIPLLVTFTVRLSI